MPESDCSDKLYPLQNQVIGLIKGLDVDFYLSGGTALGRFYLHHRYSEDLDFFVNSLPLFKEQCEAVLVALNAADLGLTIGMTSERFLRCFVTDRDLSLKLDFINDVPVHYGTLQSFDLYNRVDSCRNILSNKISALSRLEPKDVADILYLCRVYSFSWEEIIGEAREKDLWVNPLTVSRMVQGFPLEAFKTIRWITPPDPEEACTSLSRIAEDILLGRDNSLCRSVS